MSTDGRPAADSLLWWASGADATILGDPECPVSERMRFASLGLFIWLAAAAALVAGWMIAGHLITSGDGGILRTVLRGLGSGLLAVLFALFVLNLLRLSVGLAGRRTDRIDVFSLDVLRAAAILLVTGVLAIAVAAPLQVAVVERDVQAALLASEQVAVLERARATDATELDHDVATAPAERLALAAGAATPSGFLRKVEFAYAKNRPLCWSLLIAVWLLFVAPPAIRLLADRGPYDFLVMLRNRAVLAAAGIEPEAFTIYAPDGSPQLVDAFHGARAVLEDRLAHIREQRRRNEAALAARHRSGEPTRGS